MLRLKTAAPMPELEASIDADAYWRLAEIMGEELPTIIAEYLGSTERLLAEIARAERDRDALQITKHAHDIKSSSAVLGALQLSAIARELERSSGDRTLVFPSTASATLRAEFTRVREALLRLASMQ
jgi:HPt (histidine-containing phosphotransfer) domain-containing protein